MIGNNGHNGNGNAGDGEGEDTPPAKMPGNPRHLPRDASDGPDPASTPKRYAKPRKTKREGKVGRPRAEVDLIRVYRMARRGFTNVEIATIEGITDDTLVANFSDLLRRARSKRDSALRAKQLEVAMRGNPQMLIWMGKQTLGQKDRIDHTSNDESFVKVLHGVSVNDLLPSGNGKPIRTER